MLPLILSAALIQSPAAVPPSERGSDLYQSCKANVRLMDLAEPSVSDARDGTICQTYINGFLDGNGMGGDNMICAGGATVGTLSRVYVSFMEKNPKLMDEPKAMGLYEALAIGYPCKQKTPTKPSH